jgi:hypothetical protein
MTSNRNAAEASLLLFVSKLICPPPVIYSLDYKGTITTIAKTLQCLEVHIIDRLKSGRTYFMKYDTLDRK